LQQHNSGHVWLFACSRCTAASAVLSAVVQCFPAHYPAVLAMVFAHMGLFLLIAPWVAKLLGHEAAEDDSSSSSSDEKQQQFISAGLAEAGLYQKLLPEGADV
jgi:hypothetical protein